MKKTYSVCGIKVLKINHQAGYFTVQKHDNGSCWPTVFCLVADHKSKIKLCWSDLHFYFFMGWMFKFVFIFELFKYFFSIFFLELSFLWKKSLN